jgi:DNA-binding transcriptional LysR family regulator
MSELKQLETFVAVVNHGSLSAAARQQGVVPAMIGRRLDALEERLGVKLLVRTTRSVTLTGRRGLFEDCQRILTELSEAEAAVAPVAAGRAVICGYPPRPVLAGVMWHRILPLSSWRIRISA